MMLAWIVAAACMWRGLTCDEARAVQSEVEAQIASLAPADPFTDLDAGEVRDLLETAVATVLATTRST